MFTCPIDNEQFESLKELHSHVSRTLKMKLVDFYPKYYPRKDLLTQSQLPFKDYDHYFSSFFENRANMVEFFKASSEQAARDAASQMFKARGLAKQWNFAPSTVETRTSILPSPLLLSSRAIDPNQFFDKLGWQRRFDYSNKDLSPYQKPSKIFIDTREQLPFALTGIETDYVKLDFADYTCVSDYSDTFFERKSLSDLCGTLSKGFERFNSEAARAKQAQAYLIVIVESGLAGLDLIGQTHETSKVQASPSFIKARIRKVMQTFDNIQFVFAVNHEKAESIMLQIMSLGKEAHGKDIQYLLDIGKIPV